MSISIVSHGQAGLVAALLEDLSRYCDTRIEVLLTINIPEKHRFAHGSFPFVLRLIENEIPKGFGANHNTAFQLARAEFFCVFNPDLRLNSDPFPRLMDHVRDPTIGAVAPMVVNPKGVREASARPFPTPTTILAKLFGFKSGDYASLDQMRFPDWVAGMFMLFPSAAYRKVNGFCEAYFLYYEDVDICARLRVAGYRVALCTDVVVIHDARRSSHRSFQYFRWHLSSMLRFFTSTGFRQVRRMKTTGKPADRERPDT